MPTAARRGPGSAPGSPSTTIAARTRRWPTGRRWRSGAAAGNRLWTCRRAWTTLARSPHAHSHNRNSKRCWFNRSRKRRRLPPWETHPVASGTRTTAEAASRHARRQRLVALDGATGDELEAVEQRREHLLSRGWHGCPLVV